MVVSPSQWVLLNPSTAPSVTLVGLKDRIMTSRVDVILGLGLPKVAQKQGPIYHGGETCNY